MIFPGWHSRHDGDSVERPPDAEVLWREIGDGQRVEAWLIPGRGRETGKPKPLLVYAHGNEELIDDHAWNLQRYTEMGISVLLPEYRGYARSGGSPGEDAIVDDFVYFLDLVLTRPDVERDRLIYHGASIGGGVVAQLAARRPPSVMILERSFVSLYPMARSRLAPGSLLLKHPFETDRVVSAFTPPILILHGTQDEIVPVWHGRRLHQLARNARYVEFESGHNDFPPDENEYWRVIQTFLGDHGF